MSWVYDPETGRLVEKSEHMERVIAARYRARSELSAPMVIGDAIEVTSMVDGKVYSSKSALRASYRRNGYIEVGNEEQKMPPKPVPDERSIRDSVDKALARVGIPA